MTKSLRIAAQKVMDEYYQDFALDDSFFNLDDFAARIAEVYGNVADATAKLIYQTSRSETGIGSITFSQDWWATKVVDVKEKGGFGYADISGIKFLGFEYDSQNSGIQEVSSEAGLIGSYTRTTITESWVLKHTPFVNNVFWWPLAAEGTIVFWNKKGCLPKKARVYYIPDAMDDNFKMPSSKEFTISQQALQYMLWAKQGTPVTDTTADQNSNTSQQTELNTNNAKPLP